MSTIRVGIIGYGLSGRIFHGLILRDMDNFEVRKILTRDAQKIKQARKDFPDIIIASHLEDVINDADIDLVIIATPNTSHYDVAEKSLKAGKNVVIEKPFTITTHDALRLMDLEKETGQFISVYQNRRFDGDYLTLKSLIQSDAVGRIVEMSSHFDRFRNTFKENAWREKNMPGAGVLYDLGSHLIDQTLDLFGLPNEVYADMSCQRRGPADDNFELILYYSELKVTLKVGMLVRAPRIRFVIHGTHGSYVKYGLDPQEQQLKDNLSIKDATYGLEDESLHGILYTNDNKTIRTMPGNYKAYYENIYNHMTGNEELIIKSIDGFNVIRVIEAALHSHQLHKRILFKH